MLIIGIAGGTGSGKTTVVNKIIKSLPLGEVAGKLKMVDPNAGIIEEAKTVGISFGD